MTLQNIPSRRHVIAACCALCVSGLALSPEAQAHGDKAHAAAGPVRKEQKPWGIAGEPRTARRTVTVAMGDDMRFRPDRIEVREGETVRLVIRNTGRVMHEFVLGTPEELAAHAEQMKKFPDMEHDEPYMAHVPPGQSGTIVWTFNRPGDFQFACLIAGHFQSGMVGALRVVAK
ncbi:cupredoxin family protein [Sphaerotilus sp.]|uniref:cupredoxin domain-containing protein n=1 Tax=Sphaerotilus sp. TaxID=2093942 RepID=UPI002ACE0541|nr:cupredoxin family protein [Sphaerotilus sp.]MDZ7855186.1 cupredoxin family protein [Sphaerotilus sp.]